MKIYQGYHEAGSRGENLNRYIVDIKKSKNHDISLGNLHFINLLITSNIHL